MEVWHVERKEGHGFGNPDNRKEMYERMLGFFDDHIGRGREAAATGAGDWPPAPTSPVCGEPP